ncbi:5-hydroxytryptamine (serotonin) receptor 3B-like [Scophthalmus maximus]|uniref:5-hydroxytryptamine (Serotonin) receptor 3B-like n=1 Tax=Scophthalmus maximus TaxID=52904 RepID=A0A2U9CS34_SCOMX|nr:5-hydroxytryptamine (serotonin) receptor 3B-like [Scophthalmus maximus]
MGRVQFKKRLLTLSRRQTAMSGLATLTVLAFIVSGGWGVSSSQDCSYSGLLTHLNLVPQNEALSIVRPVKNWTSTILVRLDMVLLGILDVDEKSQTVTTHVWIQTVRLRHGGEVERSECLCHTHTNHCPQTSLFPRCGSMNS